jgi:nucleotide-binding universal stress UspA family protein
MTTAVIPSPRRFRIVVALDLSEYSEVVLEHALDQAARHDAPDLHVVTVVGAKADIEATKNTLAALVLPDLEDFDCADWRARLHVRTGVPYEEIADLAAEVRADLVVIGRFGLHHRYGKARSVASRVLDAAPCPTLVVGLVDDSPDEVVQCEDCVAVRASSDGERWFCTAHSASDRVTLASAVLSPVSLTGGGLMW